MKKNRLMAIAFSLLTACVLSAIALTATADSAQNVVFLSSSGNNSNDGTSPERAVKSMSTAYKKIGGSGTIVICGKYSVSFSEEGVFPVSEQQVTVTSVYDGVDYRQSGAKLVIGTDIYIGSDMIFENLSIEQSSSPKIFGQGHNIKFGEGIETSTNGRPAAIYGGTNLTKSGVTVQNSQFFGYTVEVCSGTWQLVTCGSYRAGEDCIIGVVGDVRLIINGGTFKGTGAGNSDTEVVSGIAGSGLFGDLYMEINGGTFNSSIFGMANVGMNGSRRIAGHEGTVYMKLNGGSYSGTQISAVQEKTNFHDGDFYLDISNNVQFSSDLAFISAEGVDGTAFVSAHEVLSGYLKGFGGNIYVSSQGDDTAAGTASAPVKTLSAASKLLPNGGRIIICDKINVKNETLAESDGMIIITGKYAQGDYSASAMLDIDEKLSLCSDTKIEYLKIKCKDQAEICAGGHDLTVGDLVSVYDAESKASTGGDVTVDGNLVVSGGESAEKHVITLNSGTYLTVRGGMSDAGSAVVINGGEYYGSVYGSGSVKTKGTASVVINGGLIKANVWASEKGSSVGAGVAINGGHIYAETIGAARRNSVNGVFSIGLWGGTFYVIPSIDTTGAESVEASAIDSLAGAVAGIENKVQCVFVRDGADGDGFTPNTPIGSFGEAAKLIGEGGGKLVVMGDTKVLNNANALCAGELCVTSFGGGCDYSVAYDARLVLSGSIGLSKETVFDHIEIFAAENNTYIAANSNYLEMGGHVRCTVHHGRGVEYPVSLYGGSYVTGNSYSGTRATELVIRSGWYYRVIGGNYRSNGKSDTYRLINGDIKLTIYDGKFTNLVALNGNNDLRGDATLTVYGGEFKCPVFGMANSSPDINAANGEVKGDVTLNIYGGVFCGNLDASKDGKLDFTGKYTLNIYYGDFDRVTTIRGTEEISGGTHTSEINTNLDLKFDQPCQGEIDFTNPIAGYADPSVQYDPDTGYYYYTYSGLYGSRQAIYVTRAANLCDVGCSDPILIWTSAMQSDGAGSDIASIWAPQINKIDGRWYIYATCAKTSGDSAKRLPYVWVGGETPTDPYTYHGTIDNYDEEVAIYLSPRFIEYGGQRYICNGGFYRESDRTGHQQSLFITKLASPTAFEGKPVVIARPTTDYEDHKILEGPIALVSPAGTLYMCYAAGHTRGQEYCTGIMKFLGDKSDSLANASLWQKMDEPLHFVDYSSRVYSPGAMMFTTSPDGTEIWAVYHAKQYTYTAYTMRRLYTQKLTWENDYPVIEDPKPVDTVFTYAKNTRTVDGRISGFDRRGTVEYTPPSPSPYDVEFDDIEPFVDKPVKGGLSPLAIGLIAGGAVLAAGGAVLAGVLVSKKKKKAADIPAAPSEQNSETNG